VPTLKALGLEEGTITYIPNLGRHGSWHAAKEEASKREKSLESLNWFGFRDGKASYEEDIAR
jgi:hypothetical protein